MILIENDAVSAEGVAKMSYDSFRNLQIWLLTVRNLKLAKKRRHETPAIDPF